MLSDLSSFTYLPLAKIPPLLPLASLKYTSAAYVLRDFYADRVFCSEE